MPKEETIVTDKHQYLGKSGRMQNGEKGISVVSNDARMLIIQDAISDEVFTEKNRPKEVVALCKKCDNYNPDGIAINSYLPIPILLAEMKGS